MSDACCPPDAASPADVVEESPTSADPADHIPVWRDRALLFPATAGVFLLVGYVLDWAGLSVPGAVAHWVALLAGAWTFVPSAVRNLFHGRLGVGLLMTIAAVGGVLLGHVGEAAALAFLFSLAEALEDRAMDRAQNGLRSLLSLIPDTARVSRSDGVVSMPVSHLKQSDLLVVGAGERVATDGVVAEGRSSVDTSAITGESIPVDVGPGDAIPAGAVNGAGSLVVRATADGRDNSLTQIVALVQAAQTKKGKRARLADRIARPLVPVVLVVAAAIIAFGFVVGDPSTWVERALVVLVAASPCAMAIAVPVTVISAIGAASKFGVVIKSGAAFEAFGTIRTVAFDKTGTLTEGCPRVVETRPAPGFDSGDVLNWAAVLESASGHPLARAITDGARKAVGEESCHCDGCADAPVWPAPSGQHMTEEAGRGVTGRVAGHTVRVGHARWIDPGELGPDVTALEEAGMTVILVEADGQPAGIIGIRDELRPSAAQAVGLLHDQGIDTAMLTGDNASTAAALARQAGIAAVHAEQLPGDKAQAVAALSSRRPTAMIGDGINDAPALATATVGVAMGATGTAAAIDAADIAFTGHDLRLIPTALGHARRGRRIMTANIALALGIIVVLVPLALFGVVGLAGVVLIHEAAEVVVIGNGIRAGRRSKTDRRGLPIL